MNSIKNLHDRINKYNLFLNLVGGKMSQYSIDDETTKKVIKLSNDNKNKKNFEDVLNNVEAFQNKFTTDNDSKFEPNKVEFQRMKDIEIDSEKIKKDAESSLKDYKETSINKINDDTENKKIELVENKKTLNDNYENAVKNADDYYDKVKQNASDDAIKRGLSRSSIVINKLDAFNQGQIENYNKLNDELTSNLNQINFELSSLESQKQSALKEFDIKYAYELNEKISKLTKDLNEQQDKVLKYNNEIAKAEADYEIKYANLEKDYNESANKKEKDLLELNMKYGVNVVNKYIQDKSLKMVKNYLSSLSDEEAKSILESNSKKLKSLLGDSTFANLLTNYSA